MAPIARALSPLSLIITLGVPHPSAAQEARLQTLPVDPLVDAEWLMARDADANVMVLHVGSPNDFRDEHVAGSRLLQLSDISWDGDEGWGVEFREPDEIIGNLRALGVSRTSSVVLYGSRMTSTARAWVTFDFLGLGDRAFLLDGGMDAWKAAGGAIESGDVPTAERGDVEAGPSVDFRVSAEWLRDHLDDGALAILDARPDDEYTGADGGLDGQANAGHVAARMMGWDVLLYDGSWRNWGTRDDLPAVTGVNPR